MINATHLQQLKAQQLRETVLSRIETMANQSAVHGRTAHPRQVGLRQVRNLDSGARAGERHRQRYTYGWPAGPGVGGQVRRSLAAATLDAGAVGGSMQLQPLVDALRTELLEHSVLHADETPVAMLKPGNGKTHRAYRWSYFTTS